MKENNWRERFNKKFPEMEKFRVDENDKYNGEIENFIEQAIKEERLKWEEELVKDLTNPHMLLALKERLKTDAEKEVKKDLIEKTVIWKYTKN